MTYTIIHTYIHTYIYIHTYSTYIHYDTTRHCYDRAHGHTWHTYIHGHTSHTYMTYMTCCCMSPYTTYHVMAYIHTLVPTDTLRYIHIYHIYRPTGTRQTGTDWLTRLTNLGQPGCSDWWPDSDWLTGWPFDRLTDRLTDRVWLFHGLRLATDWLTDRLQEQTRDKLWPTCGWAVLTDWSALDWLIWTDWLAGWLAGWLRDND